MGKEKIIPILAILLLLVGTASAVYVEVNNISTNTIKIDGQDYSIDELINLGEIITIKTDEGEKTGVSLESLIIKSNIGCPSCFIYTIKGADGFQQTIEWEIMKTGILTDYSRVYFPDTAHKFWVKGVYEIEVKQQ
jgi:hypothetical protein